MIIIVGDKVRPASTELGLPHDTVWDVHGTIGGLKLYPQNAKAHAVRHYVSGLRFKPDDFEVVYERNGEWVPSKPVSFKPSEDRGWRADGVINVAEQPDESLREPKAVTKAREALVEAIKDSEQQNDELAKARLIEAKRKAELRAAQLEAQRKEELRKAEAQARADAQRQALQARLHADRCLAEATLALVGEVSRLNSGEGERPAESSIAAHCDQLQALARSYGYRIAKPGAIALVIKL